MYFKGQIRPWLEVQPAIAMGGAGGKGTNPEQLFAAGHSACFIDAMKFVAGRDKLPIPTVSMIGTV